MPIPTNDLMFYLKRQSPSAFSLKEYCGLDVIGFRLSSPYADITFEGRTRGIAYGQFFISADTGRNRNNLIPRHELEAFAKYFSEMDITPFGDAFSAGVLCDINCVANALCSHFCIPNANVSRRLPS